MIQFKTLAASLIGVTVAALAVPAVAAPTVASAADPLTTANCIVHQLPQGARMFRASDGSLRVQAAGRRGNVARWTITAGPAAVRVVRDGGMAGLDRNLAGTCY